MSDISVYERPALACDCALFRVAGNNDDKTARLQVRLVRRQWNPDEGKLALIGAFVPVDDRIEEVMRRTIETKGGYAENIVFEQLHTFDTPGRDERWRVISVAHWGAVADGADPSTEIAGVDWYDVSPDREFAVSPAGEHVLLSDLAFDHGEILLFALRRLSESVRSTGIALDFLPDQFYISDIGRVVEAISGRTENNVQRKFAKLLEPVPRNDTGVSPQVRDAGEENTGKRPAHRPPVLYRRKAVPMDERK